MFGVAEENGVASPKAMVNTNLKTIRVIRRRTVLDKIVGQIARQVWSSRVGLKELLHRREYQSLRKLVAWRPRGLILLVAGVYGQRIPASIATELIADKFAADQPGGVGVEQIVLYGAAGGLSKVSGELGGRGGVGKILTWLAEPPPVVPGGEKSLLPDDRPGNSCPKLILPKGCGATAILVCKAVASVEEIVAYVLKAAAMKAVGS